MRKRKRFDRKEDVEVLAFLSRTRIEADRIGRRVRRVEARDTLRAVWQKAGEEIVAMLGEGGRAVTSAQVTTVGGLIPYAVVSYSVEEEAALRPARFGIDAVEGALFDGYTRGERWNGFACPYFTYEQAQHVLGAFVRAGDKGAHYDADRDEFVFCGVGEPMEEPDRIGPVQVGGVAYYPIGAFGWTWWQEGDFGGGEVAR